mgnify:FL=1
MEKIQEIITDQIDDPAIAMRGELDRETLWELSDNIKQNGLINPITVRPKNGRYEVVAGHRRLSACKIAGLVKIQCVVRELDDQKTFEIMAAENLERADVDPVEEANFLAGWLQRGEKTIPEIAKSIKRSVKYVEDRLAIASMPDYMQAFLKVKSISIGVALNLMQIRPEHLTRMWTEQAVRDGINVATAELWVHQNKMSQLPGGTLSDLPPSEIVSGVFAPTMFECAVDGKKYDCRMFKTVMVYEGNYDFFQEVVKKIREQSDEK